MISQEITKYIEGMTDRKDVMQWAETHLSAYLEKNKMETEEIEHIIDFLSSDKAPAKVSKMSVEEARKHTEKWNKTLQKKGHGIKETEKDTEVVLDFKDGFKIVKLIGENAYKREGFLMRHCVSSYYGKSDEIYSLRDEKNEPHATLSKSSQQIKGKGNGKIDPKYIDYVVKFLEHVGISVRDSEMKNLGYINMEKFKKELHKDTVYFQDKYIYEENKLIGVDGKEFSSFDLWDVKPLVSEFKNSLKINFNLPNFIKLSFDYLLLKIKNASSGDHAKNASSGDHAKNASSGDSATNASSGYYATNASSGIYAKNASSGDSAKNASSGYYATNASSGIYAKNASSGYYATNASSGYYATNASSGTYATNASSGTYATNASSGDHATNASSGDSAKNASSGDSATNEMLGNCSVSVDAGMNGKAKGKIGCWFCLSEWKYDSKKNINIPLCVKAVQIDGKKIKEDVWYTLKNSEFVEVI